MTKHIILSWHPRDQVRAVHLTPYWDSQPRSDITRVRRAKLLSPLCHQCGLPLIPGKQSLAGTHHVRHFWQIFNTVLWKRRR